MVRAVIEQLLSLRTGACDRDARCTDRVDGLDDRQTVAAARGVGEHEVARTDEAIVDDRSVGREICHPGRGAVLERDLRGELDQQIGRNDRDLAGDAVPGHIERGDHRHPLADPRIVDPAAHRLDDAGGLNAEQRRQHRLDEVLAGLE